MELLSFNENGIYCQQADVYIDAWKPVKRSLITHGHADHARWGNEAYLCTVNAYPVMQYRLGPDAKIQTIDYGETIDINGVTFSFHPAGHVIGSAQIRVEYKGEVWVVSGDYKLEDDGISEAFEPIRCHTYITESTFGLPIYRWQPQSEIFDEVNEWWRQNQEDGKVTLLSGYSLGKAQRILQNIDPSIGPIFTHGAVENINQVIRQQGIKLNDTTRVSADLPKTAYKGGLVIAPPSALGSPWVKKFKPFSTGIASGWMSLRGARRRRAVDRGFVLSDHADWPELNESIKLTEASKVYVTHGYTTVFSNWLQEQGLESGVVETQYEGELGEISESSVNQEGDKEEETA